MKPFNPSKEWLLKVAAAEDEAGGINIGSADEVMVRALIDRVAKLDAALQKVRSHVLLAAIPLAIEHNEMLISATRVYEALEYIEAALGDRL
jgi:hypothetical protein